MLFHFTLALSSLLDGWFTVAVSLFVHRAAGSAGELGLALLAAGFMSGTFLGALFIAPRADRIGRAPFVHALMPLAGGLSLAACAVPEGALFALFFAIGLCLGADEPVSQAVIAEHAAASHREKSLSLMMLTWFAGALAAIGAILALRAADLSYSWLFAVPALLIAATFPVRLAFRDRAGFRPAQGALPVPPLRPWRREWLFCTAFWTCQTVPVTAFMIFTPYIMSSVTGSENELLHMSLLYAGFFLGTLPMAATPLSRRPKRILLSTAALLSASLFMLAHLGAGSPWLSFWLFVYAAAYGVQAALDVVFPNTLFPTAVRARAVGSVFAAARGISIAVAFFFPWLSGLFPLRALLLAGAAVSLLGGASLLILPRGSSHSGG